jgi:hypothetical protein
MIEHSPDQLESNVLEGQGRSVKEFHDPLIRPDLYERNRRWMSESRIRVTAHLQQLGIRNVTGHEWRHDRGRHIGIGPSWKFG